jgi:phenylpyruvate tautomerase PptA (4-oxalocrotonate tautomerase family)
VSSVHHLLWHPAEAVDFVVIDEVETQNCLAWGGLPVEQLRAQRRPQNDG